VLSACDVDNLASLASQAGVNTVLDLFLPILAERRFYIEGVSVSLITRIEHHDAQLCIMASGDKYLLTSEGRAGISVDHVSGLGECACGICVCWAGGNEPRIVLSTAPDNEKALEALFDNRYCGHLIGSTGAGRCDQWRNGRTRECEHFRIGQRSFPC
jgi:hypothetical protein